MKILYLNSLYAPNLAGGAERVLQSQVEAMHQAGHEVAVLTISAEPGLQRHLINDIPVWSAGIRNVYFHYNEALERKTGRLAHNLWHLLDISNPLMSSFIRTVVREFQPEVASVHNLGGWSIRAWDTFAACHIPVVQTLHDQYLLCPTSVMFRDGHRCERQCAPCRLMRCRHRRRSSRVDTVVGVSRFIHDKLIAFGYFQEVRRTLVIPNIWDNSEECLPREARTDDGMVVFGFIGRLQASKGIEFLLECFQRSKEKNWRLLVAGTGEARYEAYLKEKFRDHQIEFLGQVSQTAFFPKIDFTVIPSLLEEAVPSIAYESLLFGRPILGSDSGGIPEFVTPGNGRLFRPGDHVDFERGLQQMTEKRAMFRAGFNAIQQEAAPYKDKKRWVTQWSQVYASAINSYRSESSSHR